MQLVDKQDDAPFGLDNLLEHGLESLFKFAPVLGAGDQRAQVKRHQLLVAQPRRHVALDDPLRQAFDDRRLADARFADQHRIVLGAAAQDLDHAANLLVAADHGVQLALARLFGQVAAVLGQRLVLPFGVVGRHALVAADAGQRLHDAVIVDAVALQQLAHLGLRGGHRQQQMLGGGVIVADIGGDIFGFLQDGGRIAAQPHLHRRAGGARQGGNGLGYAALDQRGVHADLVKDGRHDAALLFQQRLEQMLGLDGRLVILLGQALRLSQRRLGFLCQFF